jgi:hypothetical protein
VHLIVEGTGEDSTHPNVLDKNFSMSLTYNSGQKLKINNFEEEAGVYSFLSGEVLVSTMEEGRTIYGLQITLCGPGILCFGAYYNRTTTFRADPGDEIGMERRGKSMTISVEGKVVRKVWMTGIDLDGSDTLFLSRRAGNVVVRNEFEEAPKERSLKVEDILSLFHKKNCCSDVNCRLPYIVEHGEVLLQEEEVEGKTLLMDREEVHSSIATETEEGSCRSEVTLDCIPVSYIDSSSFGRLSIPEFCDDLSPSQEKEEEERGEIVHEGESLTVRFRAVNYSFPEEGLWFHGLSYHVEGEEAVFGGNVWRLRAGLHYTLKMCNDLPRPHLFDSSVEFQSSYYSYFTINNHVHGLVLDSVQDNVDLKIQPQTCVQYNYSLPRNHMSGTHWSHPHYHGASGVHVGLGGFMMLDVDVNHLETRDPPEYIRDEKSPFLSL